MRTANATEALMRRTDRKMAARLIERGWKVTPPGGEEDNACGPLPDGGWHCRPWDCDRPADCLLPDDPCADGCSDPAAHAEGAHDI